MQTVANPCAAICAAMLNGACQRASADPCPNNTTGHPAAGLMPAGMNGDRRRFPVIDDALAENEATGAASSSVA